MIRVGIGGTRAVVASAVVVALAVGAGALVGVVLVLRHGGLVTFSVVD